MLEAVNGLVWLFELQFADTSLQDYHYELLLCMFNGFTSSLVLQVPSLEFCFLPDLIS